MKTIIITLLILLSISITYCQDSNKNKTNYKQMDKVIKTNDEWKKQLTPIQFQVTRENGTERPYSGEYEDFFEEGTYTCICCGAELFDSDKKYNSGCGWPAFSDLKDNKNVILKNDISFGMKRTEVRCAKCDAHLGHVFPDGPKPTGLRYCINSVSIKFVPAKK